MAASSLGWRGALLFGAPRSAGVKGFQALPVPPPENIQEQRIWLSGRSPQGSITNPKAQQGYPVLTCSPRPTLDKCIERRKMLTCSVQQELSLRYFGY